MTGKLSPKQKDYPAYVDVYPENQRGIHAIRVLDGKKDFIASFHRKTGELEWVSEPLVASTSFVVANDYLVAARGFPGDKSAMYVLFKDDIVEQAWRD